MRSKIFFPGILLLLILLFSVKSYASNGVSADWPYEETMCNDNPNNPYYWLPFSEESSVSLLDYALDIDNPRTGYVISPFEGDVEYSLNLQLFLVYRTVSILTEIRQIAFQLVRSGLFSLELYASFWLVW